MTRVLFDELEFPKVIMILVIMVGIPIFISIYTRLGRTSEPVQHPQVLDKNPSATPVSDTRRTGPYPGFQPNERFVPMPRSHDLCPTFPRPRWESSIRPTRRDWSSIRGRRDPCRCPRDPPILTEKRHSGDLGRRGAVALVLSPRPRRRRITSV